MTLAVRLRLHLRCASGDRLCVRDNLGSRTASESGPSVCFRPKADNAALQLRSDTADHPRVRAQLHEPLRPQGCPRCRDGCACDQACHARG